MNNLYVVQKERIYEKLNSVLNELLRAPFEIKRTENGKPYIDGDPLFFSLSHSGERGVIAVSDRPIGVDLELYKHKEHPALLSRFTDEEKSEISSERDFLIHWTVREAFIKMKGGTIAGYLKSMTYSGGNLYFGGEKQSCTLQTHFFEFGVLTVCLGDK